MNSQRKKQIEALPNPLLRWAAFIIPVWGFLALILLQINFPPSSHILVGPDDYMHGVRVLDMLSGKGEVYLQPRMGPEGGAEILWSRLVDIPQALLTTLFIPFAVDIEASLYWMATILPLLQLLVLMVLVCWAVTPLTGNKMAVLAIFVLLSLIKVVSEFKVGRIDHHSWQIMLMMAGYGAMVRLYFEPQSRSWPLLAGVCFATGFAIGADIVLWAGLAAVLGGLYWLQDPQKYERANLSFGVFLFLTTLLYLLILQPASHFFMTACDGLSLTYLALAGAVLLFWFGVKAVPVSFKAHLPQRIMISTGLLILLMGSLYLLFPACFSDPYGLANEKLYNIWQSQIEEARPFWVHMQFFPLKSLFFLLPVVLGLAAAIAAVFIDKDSKKFWISFAVIMALGLIISLFQIRVLTFSQVLSIWPLSWGLLVIWTKLKAITYGVREIVGLGAFFAIVLTILASGNEQTPVDTKKNNYTYCPVVQVSDALNRYDELTLMTSYIFNGSEMLFRTHHRVLATPYHRNAAGMLTTYDIFVADADEAQALAEQYGVDMILVCPGYWPFPPEEISGDNTLIKKLLMDKPPRWLKRETGITNGGFWAYRVL